MARLQPFQRHAITAPVFDRTKLHRPRLVEILQDNLWRRLILIVAPAGYGKTTLLADLTAHTDRPVCWVRLTEHDQDPMRLARVLVDSLRSRFPHARKRLNLAGLETLPAEGVGRTLAAAIAQAISRSLLLVIDDLHLLSGSQGSAAFLSGLVGAAPPNLCCILSGREVLDLPLAKPTAEGNILTIGHGDLALGEDELEGLLASDERSPVDEPTRRRLMFDTKGWVAGVLLLRLRGLEALQASTPDGKELTYEYFAGEVLGKQPEELQDFVLRSSVLPVMTAEGVEKVVGVDDGSRWLRMALAKGLFVSTSGTSPRTYEYHPLFREYLLGTLGRTDSRLLRSLTMLAARHLANKGEDEQAVQLYLSAGASSRAMAVAATAATRMEREGRLSTLETWDKLLSSKGPLSPRILLALSGLYRDVGMPAKALKAYNRGSRLARMGKDATLSTEFELVRGWIQLDRGDAAAARRVAKRICRNHKSRPGSANARASALRLLALAIQQGGGNIDEAVECSREATRLLRHAAACPRASGLLTHWTILGHAGRFAEAVMARKECEDASLATDSPYIRTALYNNLAVDAALEGRLDDSLRFIAEAETWVGKSGSLTLESVVLSTLADLYCELGRLPEAIRMFDEAHQVAAKSGVVHWLRYIELRKAIALRRIGSYDSAKRELRKARRFGSGASWHPEVEIERLAQTIGSRGRTALQKMDRLRFGGARKFSTPQLAILAVHRARAMLALGHTEQATRALKEGISLGRSSGTLFLLTGELRAARDLLSHAKSILSGDQGYVELEQYLCLGDKLPDLGTGFDGMRRPLRILEVHALGNMEILYAARSLALRPRALELLLYLVDHGSVPREAILELLWGHLDVDKQAANLHSAVYALRRSIGRSAIDTSGGMLRLATELTVQYDAKAFLTEIARCRSMASGRGGDLASWERAARLYGGPFLPAFDSAWVRERRDELEATYLQTAAALGNEALVANSPDPAIPQLVRAVSYDHYREDLVMLLVRCLRAAGRTAEALHAARRFARLIQDDLGLGPSEEFLNLVALFGTGNQHAVAESPLAGVVTADRVSRIPRVALDIS